ncbi:uncharacterized protein LOC143017745 [Oratosquilla oratoria]|uniref:uncharacterized protein LOC143017745 n=1 Tax=Oratosquilla oratoria TaxID=337810 RepID=UPI003F75DEAE
MDLYNRPRPLRLSRYTHRFVYSCWISSSILNTSHRQASDLDNTTLHSSPPPSRPSLPDMPPDGMTTRSGRLIRRPDWFNYVARVAPYPPRRPLSKSGGSGVVT